MALSYNQCLLMSAHAYLDTLDPNNRPPPHIIEPEVIKHINEMLDYVNKYQPKGQKYKALTTLPPMLIADLVKELYHVHLISCADTSTDPIYDILGLYIGGVAHFFFSCALGSVLPFHTGLRRCRTLFVKS